ncbi:hypothetical protein LIER_20089 [Lithospermum erythrorhizon]|uniref:Uncharacterized protein n=1 Tax=Lithospermum erythrorhizon TaxID=34254 RepID=A0AAV3QMJ6_LITER
MTLDIRSRLSLMTFSSVRELKNVALRVEMEQAEFRARRENTKRGRQEISRNSGYIATHYPQSRGASSSSNTFRPVQSVRGGFQGGRFGGRGNQGRGAGNSQGNVGAGRGRIFTVT